MKVGKRLTRETVVVKTGTEASKGSEGLLLIDYVLLFPLVKVFMARVHELRLLPTTD